MNKSFTNKNLDNINIKNMSIDQDSSVRNEK